jgi:hypothetical protein
VSDAIRAALGERACLGASVDRADAATDRSTYAATHSGSDAATDRSPDAGSVCRTAGVGRGPCPSEQRSLSDRETSAQCPGDHG